MRLALLLFAFLLTACSADDGSSSDESRQLNAAAAKTDINASEPAQ